ncbi:MAG: exodeoxyribonuclease VII small subunit [Bacteroidota bacterium]
MAKKETKGSFEQSLQRLEKIVSDLEQGNVPLERSIELFEEGIKLSKECLEFLNTAELKIKQLSKDINGKYNISEFEKE